MKKNYIVPKTVSVVVDCTELIAQSPLPYSDISHAQELTEGNGDPEVTLVKGQGLNYSIWDEEW